MTSSFRPDGPPKKQPGHCTLCGKRVFEVLQTYQDPNAMGYPRRLGAPEADAERCSFILSRGNMIDLTFCSDCADAVHSAKADQAPGLQIFREIWHRCLEATRWEQENRVALGAKDLSATQAKIQSDRLVADAEDFIIQWASRGKWSDILRTGGYGAIGGKANV